MAVERPAEITILHVDDEPDLAAVTGEHLEREDDRITVRSVIDAETGLHALTKESVDCIVSDYDMPGQDGIEFLETVRNEYPELPFILYTGKGSEEVASDAIRAGVTDYLQKETDPDHYRLLANRIVNAVERYRATERVEQAQERYRSLFEEMNEGAALHELVYEAGEPIGYEILEVNRNFEAMLDIPAEQAIGRRAVDVYDTEEPPYIDRYATVTETGESMEFETYVPALDQHFHISAFSPSEGQFATVFTDISEKSEVEAQLRRERALHDAQSDATLDGYLVVDDDRTIVSYNARLLELWDIPESLIEGRDDKAVLDYVVEKTADPEAFRTLVESLYDQPNAESRDEIELADGRWFDRYSTPVIDEDGTRFGRLWVFRDITDRKERERQLELFRQAVEQTAHAVYITDADGTIEYVNPAFEDVTGYPEEEALGSDPRILQSGEYDEDYYEEFWATITDGERWRKEMIDRDADGDRIVLEQSIAPITDPDGDPEKFVAVAQDVTKREETERDLERAREELRQIIDLVPDLIFAKDREGRYLLANETTAEAYGLSPEDVEGALESNVIPDVEDSEEFREDDLAVIESGERQVIPEEKLTTADGETRILETTKIPYEVSGSGEDAVLGYGRDITELKEYERELEAQRDNLEVLNQVVRHDIRNELQLVEAYADLLQRHVDGAAENYADRVRSAARGAADILETARDVTEIMLQADTDQQPVDLASVLQKEIEDLRSRYEQAAVTVEGAIPDVAVPADDMLASVFRNLLTNAVQHNDSESPDVTVAATADGERVTVRVADNGPGIPEDRRETIFQQGETALDSAGTGLGLYLVETLVDRYGGTVAVEDNEPSGAVFVVELPIAA